MRARKIIVKETDDYDKIDKQEKEKKARKNKKESFNKRFARVIPLQSTIFLIIFVCLAAVLVTILCLVGNQKAISQDYFKANKIVKNLYLGGYKDHLNKKELKKLGITHVLTIAIGVEPVYPEEFEYLVIRAHDKGDQDLISYFPQAHAFIDEAINKENGAVLVHCMAGVSRSSTMVISYLMNKNKWSFMDAYDLVKRQRRKIKPNREFSKQLKVFEELDMNYDNFNNEDFLRILPTWHNKAQVYRYHRDNQTVTYYDQPEWLSSNNYVNDWKEFGDALVHHILHFYNRYFKYVQTTAPK